MSIMAKRFITKGRGRTRKVIPLRGKARKGLAVGSVAWQESMMASIKKKMDAGIELTGTDKAFLDIQVEHVAQLVRPVPKMPEARAARDPTRPITASEFKGMPAEDIHARLKMLESIASSSPETGEDIVLFLNDKDPTGRLAREYEMLMEW